MNAFSLFIGEPRDCHATEYLSYINRNKTMGENNFVHGNRYVITDSFKDMSNALNYVYYYWSLVVRKPVSGVSDQVRHKSGCTTTENS